MKGSRKTLAGLALAAALSTGTAAHGQQTVVLDNGDRITGTLASVDGGTWVFTYGGGEVGVAAGSVVSFTAEDPIGIRLADGTIVAASVTTADGRLRLSAADGSVRAVRPDALAAVGDPADLESLVPIPIGYFSPIDKFWGATAALGFSDKSGNSKSRGFSFDISVARGTVKDRLTFKLGVNRDQAAPTGDGELETTVEKYFGSARVDVFVGGRVFVFGFTRQERDTFQDIDLRSNYDAGFGFQAIASASTDLRFSGAGGARREAFTSGGSMTTGTLTMGADFEQVVGPATFNWSGTFGPSVENFSDYRFRSDATVTIAVYEGLGFRFGVRNDLNNSPRPGVKKHDMVVTSLLTYTIEG